MLPVKTAINAALIFAAAALPFAAHAQSENYPGKVIRFICPFPPGGANDLLARLFAQKMADQYGQQVFVDNRGGAGGQTRAVNRGSRLRDVNVRESDDAPSILISRLRHTSPGSHPLKGSPAPPFDGV